MEYYFCTNIDEGIASLNAEESAHCIKVMRHRQGDRLQIFDGNGHVYNCEIIDANHRGVQLQIIESLKDDRALNYDLCMGVCPTKNRERFEAFVEKATEMGFSKLVVLQSKNSERKILKTERVDKIILSAAKQSLKSKLPVLEPLRTLEDFVQSAEIEDYSHKYIACCFEPSSPRQSLVKNLAAIKIEDRAKILILIGPEGDFTAKEVEDAIAKGFVPVHLGTSRLRTETAALTAVSAVYLHFN